jgi:membrane-associated phospholipid phosphatase
MKFVGKLGGDFIKVVQSPKKWDKNDFLSLGIVLGTGALLFIFDEDFHTWFQDNKTSSSKNYSKFFSTLGSGYFIPGLTASLYIAGELTNSANLRKTALLSLESWMISGLIVGTFKVIIGRSRPSKDEGKASFHPFSFKSGFRALPSGHSSSAFAVAAVIAGQSKKFYVDFLSYTLATFVALSRVHDNKHWMSDVFIGSVIGYAVGKKILALSRSKNSDKVSLGFQLSPQKQAVSLSIFF